MSLHGTNNVNIMLATSSAVDSLDFSGVSEFVCVYESVFFDCFPFCGLSHRISYAIGCFFINIEQNDKQWLNPQRCNPFSFYFGKFVVALNSGLFFSALPFSS